MSKSRTILLAFASIGWSAAADAHAMLDEGLVRMMVANKTMYRGFSICVFGKGTDWSFSASPLMPNLPILSRYSFNSEADTEALALADAKERIDLHLLSSYRSLSA